MKITLDLPDWIFLHNVRVFAGIELVARLFKDGQWEIKTTRCNKCGKCCMGFKADARHIFPIVDGHCVHLHKEPHLPGTQPQYLCALSVNRPFGCSAVTPQADYCIVRFDTIEN